MRSNVGVIGERNSCLGKMLRMLLVLLLVLYTGLVVWTDTKNSPNPDETAHMAAGIAIWRLNRLDVYPVNPPLVRALATLPIVYDCPETDLSSLYEDSFPGRRSEFSFGIGFIRDNQDRAMRFFTLARWACIPLCLVGGYFVSVSRNTSSWP